MNMGYVVVWLACGVLAAYLYQQRGHASAWGLWGGLVLGPIGLVLAWLTPPRETAATPSASPTHNLLIFGVVMLAAALWCVLSPLIPHLF